MAATTVEVPIDEVAQLLGLDPNADRETVLATMRHVLAERESAEIAAKHQQEDERKVAAAIRDGRIGASRREFWLQALHEDRHGATRVLAMLTPVPEVLHAAATPPRAVAASSPAPAARRRATSIDAAARHQCPDDVGRRGGSRVVGARIPRRH
jgi:hypothetical protein